MDEDIPEDKTVRQEYYVTENGKRIGGPCFSREQAESGLRSIVKYRRNEFRSVKEEEDYEMTLNIIEVPWYTPRPKR